MGNLGCVFITRSAVPRSPWAASGSVSSSLRRITHPFAARPGGSHSRRAGRGQLPVRVGDPRAAFAGRLPLAPSHVSAMRHHGYRLLAELSHALDARWGPHSIDRFATADDCQPLQPPCTGRSNPTPTPRRRYGRMPSRCPWRAKTIGARVSHTHTAADRGGGPYARLGRTRHHHCLVGGVAVRAGAPAWPRPGCRRRAPAWARKRLPARPAEARPPVGGGPPGVPRL